MKELIVGVTTQTSIIPNLLLQLLPLDLEIELISLKENWESQDLALIQVEMKKYCMVRDQHLNIQLALGDKVQPQKMNQALDSMIKKIYLVKIRKESTLEGNL
jgi:hypothetical protein